MNELKPLLESGIDRLGLALSPSVVEGLLAYLALLVKWNQAYNLTAVREPREMVVRHLLDSLAVVPYLRGERIIDVGTGGGLPGIPLSLVFPERQFTLLDSNGKKTRFLVQVKGALGLDNVTVVHERVELYRPEAPFDCVITRAFASIADILAGSRHLLGTRGEVLAMKGAVPQQELQHLPGGYHLSEVIALMVPGLEQEQRHLLRFAHEGDSGSEGNAGEGM